MGKTAQITLTVHHHDSAGSIAALERQVSELHASGINQQLHALNCPASQKLALLDAIIEALRKRNSEQA